MAQSPTSEHRAGLIRQMARDLNGARPHGSASSRASNPDTNTNTDIEITNSVFDPENEAIASTKQMDNFSQRLPELRASAKKYKNYSQPELDYQIDTSAIHRAFPDFSQVGPSSEEEEAEQSISIEKGRGYPSVGQGTAADFSSLAFGDSLDLSPQNHRFTSSPPKAAAPVSRKEVTASLRNDNKHRRVSSVHKESTRPSPSLATKATDYGSGGSRQSSAGNRGTYAAAHARVSEEDSATHFSDDRPPTVTVTSRSTRFGSGKAAQSQDPASTNLPRNFSSSKDFLHNVSRGGASAQHTKEPAGNSIPPTPNQMTQQSFMIPDMPNISELVSGIYEDGTPVFSRHIRAHNSSRFASRTGRKSRLGHAIVSTIPVPEDEQAIFASLKLLQEKIADLENNRAESEALIQDLQEKNQILEKEKDERRRFRRSDSALGTTSGSDGGDEVGQGSRRAIIERTRLETTARTLQEQLNSANRKVTTSRTSIERISGERDSAVSQLGNVYIQLRTLIEDNERLRKENEELKSENAKLKRKTSVPVSQERRQEEPTVANNAARTVNRDEDRTPTDLDFTQILDVDARPRSQYQPTETRTDRTEQSTSRKTRPTVEKPKKTRLVLEEYSESEISEGNLTQGNTSRQPTETGVRIAKFPSGRVGAVGDYTILTNIRDEQYAELRRALEQERRNGKGRIRGSSAAGPVHEVPSSVPNENTTAPKSALPRKSSMKDLTGRLSQRKDDSRRIQLDFDLTRQTRASETPQPQAEYSLLEQQNRRHGITMENMTSAFIVPDITIRNPGEATIKLSAAAREVFDRLANHNGQNCTICKRVIDHDSPHSHTEKVTVPKPIPVSQRMPSPGPYEEEPTMRPSQPPSLALAKVMKDLEDELAHLKMQLAQHQALYNKHDPSLSKRKRKAVLASIEKLLQTIDVKADQIYALYDVLEGQRANGQEMTEREVEVTLHNVGIDVGGLGLRGGGGNDLDSEGESQGFNENGEEEEEGEEMQREEEYSRPRSRQGAAEVVSKQAPANKKKQKHVWDLSTDDEEDLPWEGCESTAEVTGRSGAAAARRRRSVGA